MMGTGMVSQRSTERSSHMLLEGYLQIGGDLKIRAGLNLMANQMRNEGRHELNSPVSLVVRMGNGESKVLTPP